MTPVETYDPTLLRLNRQAEGCLRLGPRALVCGGRVLSAGKPVEGRVQQTRSLLTAAEVAERLGVPTSWVY